MHLDISDHRGTKSAGNISMNVTACEIHDDHVLFRLEGGNTCAVEQRGGSGQQADSLTRLAQHLASELLDPDGRCALTHAGGSGRCDGNVVAVRWCDGFADEVCQVHAARAASHGITVVYPQPHDGTTQTIKTRPAPAGAAANPAVTATAV